MLRSLYWRLTLAGVLLVACGSRPGTPPPPTRLYPLPRMASPEYGIQAFLWWHVDNKTGARDADLVQALGFGWIKQEFLWAEMQHSAGETFDWFRTDGLVRLAEERQLKILARLGAAPFWAVNAAADGLPVGKADFAHYCGAVAQRYAGRVAAYEVWNEPNLTREWNNQPPDPAGYVQLLKACYLAIKQADPQAMVVSAGLAPTGTDDPAVAIPDEAFFQGMYAAGGAPYFDVLGVHAPGYMNPPERSPDETLADPALNARWITFRHVEDIRALMVANGDAEKQIAITEMGWTTDLVNPAYSWYAVDQATQADYLVRAYQYAKVHWSPWIGLMSMVYIADPQWTEANEQYWWSITRPTAPGDPAVLLPAYTALQTMPK